MTTAIHEHPERTYPKFNFLPKAESLSGSHRLIEVVNANTSVSAAASYDRILFVGAAEAITCLFVSSGATEVYYFTTSAANVHEEYNSEMVASLLRARSEKPEATFTNVIDMMEWLDR